MDESTSSAASTDTGSSVDTSAAVDTSTTDSTSPAENQAEDTTQPVPTGPAPDTTDPGLPDHGVDPDKGIDPDAGDAPTQQSEDTDQVDFKNMSRSERKAYFQELSQESSKQVEQAINAAYQPQSVNELTQAYMDEGYDEFQAQILARETVRDQQAQIQEARTQISELNAGLTTDAMSVISTIDWLNPMNKESYDQKSTEAASQLYENLCITRDDNSNQIVEAKMTPTQFFSLMNTIRSSGSETAALNAQKAAEQQLAAVAPPSSSTRSSREKSFDSMSASEQREHLLAKGIQIT